MARITKNMVICCILAAPPTFLDFTFSFFLLNHQNFHALLLRLYKYRNVRESEKYDRNNMIFRTSGMNTTRLKKKIIFFSSPNNFLSNFQKNSPEPTKNHSHQKVAFFQKGWKNYCEVGFEKFFFLDIVSWSPGARKSGLFQSYSPHSQQFKI